MPAAVKFQTPWMGGGPIQADKEVVVRNVTDTADAVVYTSTSGDSVGDNPVTTDEYGLLTTYLAPGRYVLKDGDGQRSDITVATPGADAPPSTGEFLLPEGAFIDTTTYSDPVAEVNGRPDVAMPVVVIPASMVDCSVFAFAVEGDAFPRLILSANPRGWGLGLYDGDTDPVNEGGAAINLMADGRLVLAGAGGAAIRSPGDVQHDLGTGPLVVSPNGTLYRIGASDMGEVILTEVP